MNDEIRYAVVDADGWCGETRRVFSVHATAQEAVKEASGNQFVAIERPGAYRGETFPSSLPIVRVRVQRKITVDENGAPSEPLKLAATASECRPGKFASDVTVGMLVSASDGRYRVSAISPAAEYAAGRKHHAIVWLDPV